MSYGEVDLQIKLLKENLDDVAKRMKEAIRKQAKKPQFPQGMTRNPSSVSHCLSKKHLCLNRATGT